MPVSSSRDGIAVLSKAAQAAHCTRSSVSTTWWGPLNRSWHLRADERLKGALCVQIDGVRNTKMQSVFLDDMPIHRAAFASGGSQVRSPMRITQQALVTAHHQLSACCS
jgi:hypothetical protein